LRESILRAEKIGRRNKRKWPELEPRNQDENQNNMIFGGGIGLRGTAIPTAPGIRSSYQPPSQTSLRPQLKNARENIRKISMLNFSQSSQKSTSPKSLKKERILLIDDDRPYRSCLKEYLESRGYCCSEAENGIEGLQILQEKSISMIITDNTMPQMDGLAFIERVTRDYSQEILPIFLITAELSAAVRFEAFKHGVNRVFEKPLDLQELGNAVDWVTKFDLPPTVSTKQSSSR
jgi:CheY-like chemotaxis protein